MRVPQLSLDESALKQDQRHAGEKPFRVNEPQVHSIDSFGILLNATVGCGFVAFVAAFH